MRDKTILFIKVILLFILFYYLIYSGILSFSKLSILIYNPLLTVAGCCVIFCFMVLPSIIRWWLLLNALNIHIKYSQAFLITWISIFFSTFVPGPVSADLLKGIYVQGLQKRRIKTLLFASLITDRIFGMMGIITMATVFLWLQASVISPNEELDFLMKIIDFVFIGIGFFWVFIFFPWNTKNDPLQRLLQKLPMSKKILQLYLALRVLKPHKTVLLVSLLLSLVIQGTGAYVFLEINKALSIENIPLPVLFGIVPLGELTTAVPLAPNGIGVGHLAFEYLYRLIGAHNGADAFNLFLLMRLMVCLTGAIPYLGYRSSWKYKFTNLKYAKNL